MRHVLALLTIATLGVASPAQGYQGSPDQSFAPFGDLDGKVTISGHLVTHVVQPDGKIVLAGDSFGSILVVRLLDNGELDPSFGIGGRKTITNPSFESVARSIALQPDGKFVIGGYADTQPADYVLVRITSTGALDGNFGSGGWVQTAIGTDSDIIAKVLVQPDGKIVAAGRSYIGGDWDFSVARYTASGQLDATFNDDGKATIAYGAKDECNDIALQPDGKLVLVGSNEGTFDEDIAVARLTVAGHLDPTFHFDGKLTTGLGSTEVGKAVCIQPNGHIVVAGFECMVRYRADGTFDDSFDGDGKKSLAHNVRDLALRPDGTFVLVGNRDLPSFYDFDLMLMNSDGSEYDATYGDYRYLGESTSLLDQASVSLLPDGRSVAVLPRPGSCIVMRTMPNVLPDGFGAQTVAFDDATFPAGSSETASAVAVQSDGKVVLAGGVSSSQSAESDFAVVRLEQNGALDPTFGKAGRVTLSTHTYDIAHAVALQGDGKIVVAGYTGTGNGIDFMVARFLPNGALDPAFGFFGYNLVNFSGGPDYGWAVAVAPDGKIVVAGTVYNGARNVFGVARFTADGILDNTFDGDGKGYYEFSIGPNHWVTAVVVQPDLKIVVGGHVGADFALLRLNANGTVDGTFGTSGRTLTSFGGNDFLNALVRTADGRLIAAGARDLSGHSSFALAQYQSNGTLLTVPCQRGETCTWITGKAIIDFGTESASAGAVDVRADGQIAAAGCAGEDLAWCQLSGQHASTVFTWHANGQDYGPWCGHGAKFVDPNLLMVAGSSMYGSDRSMLAMRFETTPNAVVAVEGGDPPAAGLRLAAPRPNPFARASTFAFDLPRDEPVRFALYDVAGRLVRTLLDREETAGHHILVWDGTDDRGVRVAPGVYYSHLTAGGQRLQGSVVVLR